MARKQAAKRPKARRTFTAGKRKVREECKHPVNRKIGTFCAKCGDEKAWPK